MYFDSKKEKKRREREKEFFNSNYYKVINRLIPFRTKQCTCSPLNGITAHNLGKEKVYFGKHIYFNENSKHFFYDIDESCGSEKFGEDRRLDTFQLRDLVEENLFEEIGRGGDVVNTKERMYNFKRFFIDLIPISKEGGGKRRLEGFFDIDDLFETEYSAFCNETKTFYPGDKKEQLEKKEIEKIINEKPGVEFYFNFKYEDFLKMERGEKVEQILKEEDKKKQEKEGEEYMNKNEN